MAITDGSFEADQVSALKRENYFLLTRLEWSRKQNLDLGFKVQRLEFRVRWATSAAKHLRRKIGYVLDSLLEQRRAAQCGMRGNEFGFNILTSQCRKCHATGGAEICEDECNDIGIEYDKDNPKFHEPNAGTEFWCSQCIGVGNTLASHDRIGV